MKRIAFILILFLWLFAGAKEVNGQEKQFKTAVAVDYLVSESGEVEVNYEITLVNLLSTLYAKSFTLKLTGIEPGQLEAHQGGRVLTTTQAKVDDKNTEVVVHFEDAVVGVGARREFTVRYKDRGIMTRTGEVWEATIPKLAGGDTFDEYAVALTVPKSLGNLAYISPQEDSRQEAGTGSTYFFGKEKLADRAITAAFGQFQVFAFDLTYHIENPLPRASMIEIALPPDTAYQKVNYQEITPEPRAVRVDGDGNFIAEYPLLPRARFDIKARGVVQIFAAPRPFPRPTASSLAANLAASEVWQSTDADIKSLARQLATPLAIYNYVTRNFTYDYDRVKPNVERLGAKEALANPRSAICTEFTDVFVALARAAAIPAREVNGYAHTENPKLTPLSLVADVLHAWPEYWSEERGVWVPIDPTWGATSGVDYFHNLDLRHFTFVIHGEDSFKPYPAGSYKLGPNPQKDVFVSFGQLPENRVAKPKIIVERRGLGVGPISYKVRVRNVGPVSLMGERVRVFFDNQIKEEREVVLMPPYGELELEIKIPFSLLGLKTPERILITAANESLGVVTNRPLIIVAQVAFVLVILGAALLLIYLRLKRIKLTSKLKALAASLYENLYVGRGQQK